MTRGALIAVSALALLAAPGLANAKSIKSDIPRDAVQSFCASAGLGEQAAQFTQPDGTTITGTIDCEQEDANVAEAGDDNGGALEPGDDRGGVEPGDDHGHHGEAESGDNNGSGSGNSGASNNSGSGDGGSGDDGGHGHSGKN